MPTNEWPTHIKRKVSSIDLNSSCGGYLCIAQGFSPAHNRTIALFESFSPEELRNALVFTRASRVALSTEIQWLESKVTETLNGLEFYQRRLDSRISRMDDINNQIDQMQTKQLTQVENEHLRQYLNSSYSNSEGEGESESEGGDEGEGEDEGTDEE
jgi:hypothetical protein